MARRRFLPKYVTSFIDVRGKERLRFRKVGSPSHYFAAPLGTEGFRPGLRESSENNAVDTSGSPISATEALGAPTQTSNVSTPISRAEDGVKVKTGRACGNCLGDGWVLCLNSMFMGDGYRRERCGICAGTGQSDYRPLPEHAAWQRKARLRDAAIRAHKRLHPKADYIELGRVASNAA